ncbi:Uncharacterised protein [Mycobacteroides abscessus subsp. abscessus]|nr:Uncharacterised protein [Mycobacteroides abscessus subsp. abscessus]
MIQKPRRGQLRQHRRRGIDHVDTTLDHTPHEQAGIPHGLGVE